MSRIAPLGLALLVLTCSTALGQEPLSLLAVQTDAKARDAATGGARTCRLAFDLKFTKKVALAGWVSAGAGLAATFSSARAEEGGARTWVLSRVDVPAYGVVRYNSWGKGYLHVRHLAAQEPDAALVANGRRVLADWLAHYRRVPIPESSMPSETGANSARGWYEAPPRGRVSFATVGSGLLTAKAVHTTVELAQKEEWKTHALPAFAEMTGALVPAPTAVASLTQQIAAASSWDGPDASASVNQLIAAARAAMPKYASKIPAVTARNLVPRYTARKEGAGWLVTGVVKPYAINADASLASWRRELTLNEAGAVVRETLAITLTLEDGRVEATVEHTAPDTARAE